jgi:endonuclease/exonuclease/phosphatase family metal-dependent hydrolase
MSYNIRLDLASDGENAWPNRKEMLISQIQFLSPDIFGIQEARPNQMIDLKNELKAYASIGIGRDGADNGEHAAIFYKTTNYRVENEHTFWLSETPAEFSKGWDAAYPRICTYGLFTNIESNKKFWVFNTHLDHVGNEAQLQGMQLILKKIEALNITQEPVIIMGDFNVEPDSELIVNLKKFMNDAKDLAKFEFGANATFNGFNIGEAPKRRIDYIMISKTPNVEVEKYAVPASFIDLKYPSDHFPVFIELKI